MILTVLALVSGLSFLKYGTDILFRVRLRDEFERYGMRRLRVFVGTMEVLGGLAVLLGLVVAPLGAMGAAGLMALMVLGLRVRLRLHDRVRLMIPAAILAGVNAVLVGLFLSS
ncbi:MAG: DoxX family protein [Acidimicrobiales bacterium]